MTTEGFINRLQEDAGKALIFVGPDGRRVPADYHITEIKDVSIASVDCGGRSATARETVTQLWTPRNDDAGVPMTTDKAHAIFARVGKVRALDPDAEALFEWGDQHLRMAVCHVDRLDVTSEELVVYLDVRQPVCKPALDMVPEAAHCCAPAAGCC